MGFRHCSRSKARSGDGNFPSHFVEMTFFHLCGNVPSQQHVFFLTRTNLQPDKSMDFVSPYWLSCISGTLRVSHKSTCRLLAQLGSNYPNVLGRTPRMQQLWIVKSIMASHLPSLLPSDWTEKNTLPACLCIEWSDSQFSRVRSLFKFSQMNYHLRPILSKKVDSSAVQQNNNPAKKGVSHRTRTGGSWVDGWPCSECKNFFCSDVPGIWTTYATNSAKGSQMTI